MCEFPVFACRIRERRGCVWIIPAVSPSTNTIIGLFALCSCSLVLVFRLYDQNYNRFTNALIWYCLNEHRCTDYLQPSDRNNKMISRSHDPSAWAGLGEVSAPWHPHSGTQTDRGCSFLRSWSLHEAAGLAAAGEETWGSSISASVLMSIMLLLLHYNGLNPWHGKWQCSVNQN